MSDLDFIEEIRIAQYWRKQLGEKEYVQRNPEDLRRWYEALELRGPDEIRSYLAERAGRFQPAEITGIVAKAPHPPRDIIDLWLASHNQTSTKPYWAGVFAFLLLCVLIGPNMSRCQHLKNLDKVATHPVPPAAIMPGNGTGSPLPLATMPGNFPAPANQASPTAGTQQQGRGSQQSAPQQSGPQQP